MFFQTFSLYSLVKGLHLVSIIAFMAGMMYLPRLFVYHHQALPGGEAEEKFTVMEKRLLQGIINPSLAAVWITGAILVSVQGNAVFHSGWFHVKLLLVSVISGISGFYGVSRKKFARGERPQNENFWRILNEMPFLLMTVVIFLVILKPSAGSG